MAKKPPWRGYLIRGCFALITFVGLLVLWDKPFTGRICISSFFLANGIFSLKYDELVDPKNKRERVPAYFSLIGGIVLLLFTLSTIILKLSSVPTGDPGGYIFAPIAIIIGLLQIQGGVRIMPNLGSKLLAESSLVLGIMEILLGFTLLIYQHGPGEVWEVRMVVLIWVATMIPVMFATAYRWRRKLQAAQQTQPVPQK